MTKKPNDSCLRSLLGITGLLITSSNGRTLKIQSEACGRLRRSHPQRRKAGRSTGAGADQVPICYQPEDRESARPHCAADAARPRRRGNRMNKAPRFHQVARQCGKDMEKTMRRFTLLLV